MSESISFEAPLEEDSNNESTTEDDAIAIVTATGIALAGSLVVGTMIRKYFENKTE